MTPGANPRKVIRLFQGLVGFPPEPEIDHPTAPSHGPVLVPSPKKRGRPSINGQAMSAAERKQKQREEAPRKEAINQLEAEQSREASMDRNSVPIPMFVHGAPAGAGKIIVDTKKCADIQAARAHKELIGGKRVKPQGTSPDTNGTGLSNKAAQTAVFSGKSFRVRLGSSDDEAERNAVFEDMISAGRCVVCNVECRVAHVQDAVESEATHYENAQEIRSLLEQNGASPTILGPEPQVGSHVVHFNRLFRAERRRHNAVITAANAAQAKARDERDVAAAKQRPINIEEAQKWDEIARQRARDIKNKKARKARGSKKARTIS